MPPPGFGPVIPAIEPPQTHAIDSGQRDRHKSIRSGQNAFVYGSEYMSVVQTIKLSESDVYWTVHHCDS